MGGSVSLFRPELPGNNVRIFGGRAKLPSIWMRLELARVGEIGS